MMFFRIFSSLVLIIALQACVTSPRVDYGEVDVHTDDGHVRLIFSDDDIGRIRHYYRYRHKGLPPGLAKKDRLPPGLEKQLHRNGTLPPGLSGHHLPYDLEKHLRHLPEGYVRLRVGGDVILMDNKTRVIFDIIRILGD